MTHHSKNNPYIYVAQFANNPELVKVGFTTSYKRRLNALAFVHGKIVRHKAFLVKEEDGYGVEREIHYKLDKHAVVLEGDGGTEFYSLDFETTYYFVESMVARNNTARLPSLSLANRIANSTKELTGLEKLTLFVLIVNGQYDGNGNIFTPLTYDEMARQASYSRRTAVTTVKSLAGKGVVSRGRKGVYKISFESLESP